MRQKHPFLVYVWCNVFEWEVLSVLWDAVFHSLYPCQNWNIWCCNSLKDMPAQGLLRKCCHLANTETVNYCPFFLLDKKKKKKWNKATGFKTNPQTDTLAPKNKNPTLQAAERVKWLPRCRVCEQLFDSDGTRHDETDSGGLTSNH